LIAGICGGFITFPAFGLQTHWNSPGSRGCCWGANIVLSVVLCPTAVALGHWLAALFGRT